MTRMIKWHWQHDETGEAAGTSEQEYDDSSNPPCGVCGKRSKYMEGQIDQDFMGNDIHGWWFSCHPCGVSTPAVEGNWDDDSVPYSDR